MLTKNIQLELIGPPVAVLSARTRHCHFLRRAMKRTLARASVLIHIESILDLDYKCVTKNVINLID
jgi:hypothetical protein